MSAGSDSGRSAASVVTGADLAVDDEDWTDSGKEKVGSLKEVLLLLPS